jgi:hypothetical protein
MTVSFEIPLFPIPLLTILSPDVAPTLVEPLEITNWSISTSMYFGVAKLTWLFSSNYYDTVGGHALDIGVGAKALAEGNYFKVIASSNHATNALLTCIRLSRPR